uniref:Uncharacterized protein n=1 Tax=Lepeophtheirus salmonis TaxID=72036 RepID=A0A0K2SYU2_LEPSM
MAMGHTLSEKKFKISLFCCSILLVLVCFVFN